MLRSTLVWPDPSVTLALQEARRHILCGVSPPRLPGPSRPPASAEAMLHPDEMPQRKCLFSKYRAAGSNATPGRNALNESTFDQNTGPPEAMLHPDAMFLFIHVSVCISKYAYCIHIV